MSEMTEFTTVNLSFITVQN